MSRTRKLLGATARALVLFLVIVLANLLVLYIAAGVAFRGNWDRVDNAIEDAYYEYFND